jgi:crotonobetainyl-CoA:carnitine CoA-transferase CaiB-like acyl-CoA transferase
LVDISLLDAAISLLHPHSAVWLATGESPVRTGAAHPLVAPYQVFATRTGDLFISAANDRQFKSLVDGLGRSDLAVDVRFTDNARRVQHRAELVAVLADLLAGRDRDELTVELNRRGVPASPMYTVGEALTTEQVRHRELVVEVDDYRGLGVPIKFSRSRPTPPRAPVRSGADGGSILRSLGFRTSDIDRLRAEGALGRTD